MQSSRAVVALAAIGVTAALLRNIADVEQATVLRAAHT